MEHQFDELAKALAAGVSRREALRRIGGGVVGLILASLGLGKAWGQSADVDCKKFCKSALSSDPKSKEQVATCKASCEDCQAGGNTVCGVSSAGGGAVTCCPQGCSSSGVCCGTLLASCEQSSECCSGFVCHVAGSVCCRGVSNDVCVTNEDCCPGFFECVIQPGQTVGVCNTL
jgi:hypothetical protein